jgi:peptide/nickel transport system permease protein
VRFAYFVVLLLAVIVLNFLLIHAAPGDIVETIAGIEGGMSPDLMVTLRQEYGLDQPVLVQLWIYISRVFSGNLGFSFYYNQPVLDLILARVPATLLLVLTTVLGAFVVGTTIGVMAARKPNGLLSQLTVAVSIFGFATPVFWSGIMLVMLLALAVPIFPVSGMRSVDVPQGGIAAALDVAHHLVLPSITLGIAYVGQYSRLARASMIEVLDADYIRTARSKGASETSIIMKHGLRNAILPVVTMLGLQFGNVIAGAVLVETVFNWPGLGRLAYDAVMRRDYPTILGVLTFSVVVVVVMNIITDILYSIIDPRMKRR